MSNHSIGWMEMPKQTHNKEGHTVEYHTISVSNSLEYLFDRICAMPDLSTGAFQSPKIWMLVLK